MPGKYVGYATPLEVLFDIFDDDQKMEIYNAIEVIFDKYQGHGKLIIEFRKGQPFLIGQESLKAFSLQRGC